MVSRGRDENQPLMTDYFDNADDSTMNPGPSDDESGRGASHPDAPLPANSQPKTTTTIHTTPAIDESEPASSGANARATSPLEVSDAASGISTPRFVQDESSWKRWKWVPYPVRRTCKVIAKWSKGPPDPQPYRIRPLFPRLQEFPLVLVQRFLPTKVRRFWVLFAFFSIWLITYVLVKRQGSVASEIVGWGEPEAIGCGVTYWGAGNSCGVDGNNCRPFNASGFPFRCAGNCESYHVLNPRAVGDQEVIYQPFVVGGNGTYRGDSFICGAAIHAGIVSNADGGCGVVQLVGEQAEFPSVSANGIDSVGFDSYFPLAYRFVPDLQCSARDMRWALLGISATFTGLLSLFTASPALFFFGNFIGIFWTVGTALDTPPHKSNAGLFSKILGKFLPAMFVAWVMYDKMGVRRTLKGLRAQSEKTILWLGPCWVGAMDNYTLSFIPIQRLNAHDLQQQPGAKAALAIIILVLLCVVVSQVWFFRKEGRLLKYLKLYALFIAGIVIALTLPGLDLRIHHYILALLLLPGTSMQTRPSLVYQGLLIGLFINGIARWNFDAVLQTPGELRGDAQLGTELPVINTPSIALANSTDMSSNITFIWEAPSKQKSFDGISILVNDVERFRSYFQDQVGREDEFIWSREKDLDMPEYFRFAYMDGSHSGDYTKAGIWTAEGEWQEMKPGPSKVKARNEDDDDEHVLKKRRRAL
ncbi:LCCL domain-containing protein [Emericellopsis cladophorae]|uniref:LCCL domain-containing protein n=1 Tax=Emericellopsis cladophorae TaxID=2686198 RepID=A0A9P9Y3M8_9HYPO|nr:LCCL domain-containing protein [Emericellopsis cladophorae]KAI6782892.1 LCCL domain-containing protein [Emericellopsis cladophorae]